jgi:hypothetical protein
VKRCRNTTRRTKMTSNLNPIVVVVAVHKVVIVTGIRVILGIPAIHEVAVGDVVDAPRNVLTTRTIKTKRAFTHIPRKAGRAVGTVAGEETVSVVSRVSVSPGSPVNRWS